MSCIDTLTCLPTKPLEIFNYWYYQYSIPVTVILGLLVGIIIVAIYVRTKSIAHLVVLSTYAVSVFSAMLVNDAYIEQQYHTVVIIIAVAVASVLTMFVLKLVKE